MPDIVSSQLINLCTRYVDLIDYARLNRDTGRNWTFTIDADTIRVYQDDLTIREIFEYTPSDKEIVDSLSYRKRFGFQKETISGAEVARQMRLHKFLNLEHVCYQIGLRSRLSYKSSFLTVTPIAPGLMFSVLLNESSGMRRANEIKIVITNSDESRHTHAYPFLSLRFADQLLREWDDERQVAAVNQFTSYQILIHGELLPAPYESDCCDAYSDMGFDSEIDCQMACLQRRTLSAWNKVPFSVIVNDSDSRHKMISYLDIRKDAFMHQLLQLQQQCAQGVCRRRACHFTICLTNTDVAATDHFELALTAPMQPWFHVQARPALTLIQFITYTMGVLSAFTGMGLWSVNPKRVLDRGMLRRNINPLLVSSGIQVQHFLPRESQECTQDSSEAPARL